MTNYLLIFLMLCFFSMLICLLRLHFRIEDLRDAQIKLEDARLKLDEKHSDEFSICSSRIDQLSRDPRWNKVEEIYRISQELERAQKMKNVRTNCGRGKRNVRK